MKKKSLEGWVEKDWRRYFGKHPLGVDTPQAYPTKKQCCNKPVKVRITIEEI